MIAALDVTGNPSSPHAEGRKARALLEDAREQVAALVGAKPAEVVFTSGGTEANNAVLAARWEAILVAGVEHDSVLVPARNCKSQVVDLPVGDDGVVRREALAEVMRRGGGGRALLSLQMANNETGVLQPVADVAREARAHGFAVHTDAVQAVGRAAVDFADLCVDYLTISAHKLGGPQGIGALVVRDGVGLPSFITGGGQERRRRAGTENVTAVAGFGAAAQAALADLAQMPRVRALRDQLEAQARSITPQAIIVGAAADRLPNTTSLALQDASAETLVIALDLKGIAVSAGAACSSGKVGTSHVLAAMGLPAHIARAAIRISLGATSTEHDIASFLEAWGQIALRRRERAVA
jgi:cysteine desulfurase